MGVTEKQRRAFFVWAEQARGPERAETLMELLPRRDGTTWPPSAISIGSSFEWNSGSTP